MSSWPTRMGNMQRTGKTNNILSPPLKLCWKTGLKNGGYVWNSPAISDEGVVYITLRTGKSEPFCLHALSLEDGVVLWRRDEISIYATGSATIHGDNLFVCGINGVYSLNSNTGQTCWEFPVDKLIRECAPVIKDDSLYIGSCNGFFYALDVESGSEKWKQDVKDWVTFSPSIHDNIVYFSTAASKGGKEAIFALDTQTGSFRWKYEFEGDASFHYNCTVAVHSGIIFAAVEKYGLCAFDAKTGEMLWVFKTSYGPFTAPCVSDEIVYVASRQLHAIEMKTGQEIWKSEYQGGLATSAPIITEDFVYIGGGYKRFIYAFNRHTGEKVWEYETGDIVFSTPALAFGKLLIGCHDGYLYCFEKDKN